MKSSEPIDKLLTLTRAALLCPANHCRAHLIPSQQAGLERSCESMHQHCCQLLIWLPGHSKSVQQGFMQGAPSGEGGGGHTSNGLSLALWSPTGEGHFCLCFLGQPARQFVCFLNLQTCVIELGWTSAGFSITCRATAHDHHELKVLSDGWDPGVCDVGIDACTPCSLYSSPFAGCKAHSRRPDLPSQL